MKLKATIVATVAVAIATMSIAETNGVMVASHRASPTEADIGRCFIMYGK